MDYFPWEKDLDEALASINSTPDNISDQHWKLTEGISCKDWFPEEVEYQLDPTSGVKIADSVPNSLGIIICSEKLKSILEKRCSEFEFFPIKLRNAKKKIVSKKYFVANLVGTLACMDMKKSKYKEDELDKGQIRAISELHICDDKVPEGTQIFRLAERTRLHIVLDPLADEIAVDNKCSGVSLTFLEDYGMEYR